MNSDTAKVVNTIDSEGVRNGFLMELKKEGKLTEAYLTVCYPGAVKGYHLHRVREANYVCIIGCILVKMFWLENGRIRHKLVNMIPGSKLKIDTYVATAIANKSNSVSYIVNFPNPPYDPDMTDEQVEFTEDECINGKLESFLLSELKE